MKTAPLCGAFPDAPEKTRTSTDHTVHKALNPNQPAVDQFSGVQRLPNWAVLWTSWTGWKEWMLPRCCHGPVARAARRRVRTVRGGRDAGASSSLLLPSGGLLTLGWCRPSRRSSSRPVATRSSTRTTSSLESVSGPGTLLAAHALVASFLGATTVKAKGLHGFSWAALVALLLGLIIAAVLLSNWKLRFAVDAPDLYAELYEEAAAEAASDTLGWLVSAAYGYHALRRADVQRVRIMGGLLTSLGTLMVLQTLFWLVALR